MNELKTSKDIDLTLEQQKDYTSSDTHKWHTILQQEAIKWIKVFEKSIAPNIYGVGQEGDFMEAHYNIAKIDFIKHFFNITKEDLK